MRRSANWAIFALLIGCLMLLVRYQYFRVKKGDIFSLFGWSKVKIDTKVCGPLQSISYSWGFNKDFTNIKPVFKNIRFKGLYVGNRETKDGNIDLILKIPGLLMPQYYYFDAGGADWFVDLDFADSKKQDLDTGGGPITQSLSYLTKNCPVTVDVSLFDSNTDCNQAGQEQKSCNYVSKMSGNRQDNRFLIRALLDGQLVEKLLLPWRRILHLGPIINLTV